MNCQTIQDMIGAYCDGELNAAQTLEIKQHLQGCSNCAAIREEQRVMAEVIMRHSPRFDAPPKLRSQVLNSLRAEAIGVRVLPFPQTQKWATWTIAALAFIGAFVSGLFISPRGPSGRDFLTNEIVASHVRSMMANHLADVVSTDQHTVKPWFDGKLDFAPPVVDFASKGFPLMGGRLDYLADRPVAAVVYRRDKHIINLFVRPASEQSSRIGVKTTTRQGYNLLNWTQDGTSYSAVSDLNETELRQFVELVRRSTLT